MTHTLQKATVAKATRSLGRAARKAHTRKMREAGELCRKQGIVLTPLALETLGGWHKVAEVELWKLGSARARQTGRKEGVLTDHLFQKLSILLIKGISAIISSQALSPPRY